MPNILNAADAAKILKTDQKTILKLLQQGLLKGQKVGPGWKIDANSVTSYQRQQGKQSN
ncbi:MAG: helix-turn-helix domain-containing protein [Chloroflexota bacterium]